jgi:hypothetical protein
LDNSKKRPTRPVPPASASDDKTPDPLWIWAEKEGRERDPRTGTRKPVLGDEAAARLRMLQQAAGNFAARLPSADEWATFLRTEIAPVYNSVAGSERMCVECGKRFGADRRMPVCCSAACAERNQARSSGGRRGQPIASSEHSDTTKISLDGLVAATRTPKRR